MSLPKKSFFDRNSQLPLANIFCFKFTDISFLFYVLFIYNQHIVFYICILNFIFFFLFSIKFFFAEYIYLDFGYWLVSLNYRGGPTELYCLKKEEEKHVNLQKVKLWNCHGVTTIVFVVVFLYSPPTSSADPNVNMSNSVKPSGNKYDAMI